jgi:hypothetical protein
MRILLLIYIIVFLLLNFFVDHPLIFYLAMSTFPLTVYLLIRRPRRKQRGPASPATQQEDQPTYKEDNG